MTISILDYSTAEVTILTNVSNKIGDKGIEEYLETEGFRISDIKYLVSDITMLTIK